MSMGAIVSIHEVVEEKVIKKVLGKSAGKAIDAFKALAEKYKVSCEDISRSLEDDDINELMECCPDEPDEEQFEKDCKSLYSVIEDCNEKFRKATGLKGLYLVFNRPEDCYDNIDGFAWALPHSSIYGFTPAFKKFKKDFKTDTTWSQVVKFG